MNRRVSIILVLAALIGIGSLGYEIGKWLGITLFEAFHEAPDHPR